MAAVGVVMLRHGAILVASLSLLACSADDPRRPEHVYVPADDYAVVVTIEVPKQARVGEWIPLRATRKSGPWKKVKYASVAPDAHWFVEPPPEFEDEVADNLTWLTDPPQAGRFDVPTMGEAMTHERKVRFSKPGTYKIWGDNAYPTSAKSNVVTIRVRP